MNQSVVALSRPQQEAWHQIFSNASPATLVQALEAGIVPEPCALEDGWTLLHTLFERVAKEADAAGERYWSVKGPGSAQAMQAVVLAWLDRFGPPEPRSPGVEVRLGEAKTQPVSVLEAAIGYRWPKVFEWLTSQPGFDRSTWAARAQAPLHPEGPGQEASLPWLHAAALTDREWLVQALLEWGVSVDQQDALGRTALAFARTPSIARYLLEAGASPQAQVKGVELVPYFMALKLKAVAEVVAQYQPEAGADLALGKAMRAVLELADVQNSHSRSQFHGAALDAGAQRWQQLQQQWAFLGLPPPNQWRALQASGPIKGDAAIVVQMAWEELANQHRQARGRAQKLDAVLERSLTATSLVWAMIGAEPEKWLPEPGKDLVRKGLPGLGLVGLALWCMPPAPKGGVREMGWFDEGISPEQRAKEESLMAQLWTAAPALLAQHAPQQWLDWAVEASVALGKQSTAAAWRPLALAWVRVFERRLKKDAQVGLWWTVDGQQYPELDVLEMGHRLVNSGVRLADLGFVHWWMGRLGATFNPNRTPVARWVKPEHQRRYLNVALQSLVDMWQCPIKGGSSGEGVMLEQLRSLVPELDKQLSAGFRVWPEDWPAAQTQVFDALLAEWSRQCPYYSGPMGPLTEQARRQQLQEALPAPPPSSTSRPRF